MEVMWVFSCFFFFKQKTAYEMRISDWSSDVCSSDLPDTKRENIADELFGLPVADPYRWLETDVRDSDRVRAWVEAENAVTDAYLDTLPEIGRASCRERVCLYV